MGMKVIAAIPGQCFNASHPSGDIQRITLQRGASSSRMDADLVGSTSGDRHLDQPTIWAHRQQFERAASHYCSSFTSRSRTPDGAETRMGLASYGRLDHKGLPRSQHRQPRAALRLAQQTEVNLSE